MAVPSERRGLDDRIDQGDCQLSPSRSESGQVSPDRDLWVGHSRRKRRSEYHIKRLYTIPQARNAPSKVQQRADWAQANLVRSADLSEAVFIDEAGFNLHLRRRRGRAAVGKRAAAVEPTERGRNLTLVVAIIPPVAVIAHTFYYGGVTRWRFKNFLEEDVLRWLNYYDRQGSTLVIDNVRFHHSPMVREVIADWDCDKLNTPPYTPHSNLAE